MNPKKLILGAAAGVVFSAVAGNVIADSFQQEAWNYGALRFTVGDAELAANYACGAEACSLPAAQTTDGTEIVGISTLPATYGHTFAAGFFDATDYLGAVDPDATTAWWEGWTVSDGPGSLLSSFFHPLSDNLLAGTLLPDATVTTTADCVAKWFNDGTVQNGAADIVYAGTATAEGVTFPVCAINTGAGGVPILIEDVTFTSDVMWLISGGPNLQVGEGDVAGINTNADGCDGTDADAILGGGITSADVTIDAGAQIFGDASNALQLNGLEITRGSRLFANGTADLPIVLSSADASGGVPVLSWDSAGSTANDFTDIEEFAGVVLDGCAVDSRNPGGDQASEAVQVGETRFYGGEETEDSSGSMSYVVIAESGAEFQPNEEVQGLTLEGVGSGTQLNYIQVHYSGDDGIEWFGGTVNSKYLVVSVKRDDGLDMDAGFQGFIQYALVTNSATLGDRGIESDNRSDSNPDNIPRTMPTVSNVTLLGTDGNPASGGSSNESTGHMMRQGMGGFFDKMVVADAGAADPMRWQDGCIDLDTMTPSGAPGPALAVTSGSLKYRNTLFDCDAGPGPSTGDGAGISAFKDDTDTGATTPYPVPLVVDAVLPLSRFVDVTGSIASYFSTVINAQPFTGEGCLTKPFNAQEAFYTYQTVDASNLPVGTVNTPVNIPPGPQGFVFTFDPTSAFASAPIQMQSYCENTGDAASIENLNQPVLGASAGATADIVALLTSTSLPVPLGGAAVVASGSINVGAAAGAMDVSTTSFNDAVNTTCTTCELDLAAMCLAVPAASTPVAYAPGASASIGVFCTNNGTPVPADPANNRITVDFEEGGVLKGQTSFDTSS